MRLFTRVTLGVLIACFLFACGGGEDKKGEDLQPGKLYLMTEEGLELLAYPIDKNGKQVEVGKKYLMTPNGLEEIPYLKDINGRKVEVGNEYVMTTGGLKLVRSRGIKGSVRDVSGKPLAGVEVSMAGSGRKVLTGKDGAFSLPFVEGYVRLSISVPHLPAWCPAPKIENASVTRQRYPDGWDLGVIKLPCAFVGMKYGKAVWASADGKFVDNGDGTISDFKNGLMWEAKVAKRSLSWEAAKEYVSNLGLGGNSDWRLPTPEELTALYKSGIACSWRNSAMIEDALSLWSSKQIGPASVLVVNVCTGKSRKSTALDEGPNNNPGVLAVRALGK